MIKRIMHKIKNTGSRFSKGVIWALSVIFAVLLILQIAVTAGIFWLNSQSGQNFIQTQIDNATADTGYIVSVTPVSYAFPNGFKFGAITVSDDEGVIAEIQDLVLRPSLIGLGVRSVTLSVGADNVVLHRLPQPKQTEIADDEPKPLEPFALPDIYFTSLALDSLRIDRLDIRQDVFGTEIVFSPRLETHINLGRTMRVELDLVNKPADSELPAWMPERVRFFGRLNPQTLDADIGRLDIRNDVLRLMAVGQANIGAGSLLDIAVNGRIADFSAFAEGVDGRGEVKASLGGTIDTPTVHIDGRVVMPLLAERGLGDILFTLATTDDVTPLQGQFRTHTTYQGNEVALTADFAVRDKVLKLSEIRGNAPDINVQGQVDVDLNTMIATGDVGIDVSKLGTYSVLAGVDFAGRLKTDLTLQSNDGVQGVAVTGQINDAVYDEIRLSRATIKTQLADIAMIWPKALTLDVNGLQIGADAVVQTAEAIITAQGEDRYGLSLKLNGHAVQNFTLNGTADIRGIQANTPNVQDIRITLSSAGSDITVTGRVDSENIDIALRTRGFGSGSLPVALPEPLSRLAIDADAGITGAMASPLITADVTVSPLTIAGQAHINLSLKGRYENGSARVDLAGRGDGIQAMNGYAALPMTLSLSPFVFDMPETTPLSGRVNIKAKAEDLAVLFLPVDHALRGDLNVNGTVAGTIGNPDISGTAGLTEGAYRFNPFGIELFDIALNTSLNPDSLRVDHLSANDGQNGHLRGDGTVHFANPQNTRVDINFDNFRLLKSDMADGTLSADLGLRGRADDYLLSGDVTLGQFDIVIPERFQSNIPELNIIETAQEPADPETLRGVTLDIAVVADNQIFVRGWGLDAEFGGTIDVGGTLDDPKLNGELGVRRGRYEEFGQRFELERAYLRFQGSVPPSPYLDIIATTQAGEVTAAINLSGEVSKPSIKLSSTPALPEDEILSHILFGKNLERITLFQAVQLKNTLDRFTGRGGGGFDAVGALRDLTGLDDIRVDTDEEGESSVGIGKYLSDDVYLELEKGAGEGSGAAKIQVELSPTISLESKIGQDAQAGAGIMWRWDY